MSKTLPERLRDAARKLRTSNIPLSDFIPLLQQAADYIEAQGVPDGWQLVPKESTDEMVRAALHLDLSYMPGHDGPDRAAVYKAMLASAPPAPQPQPVQQEPTLKVYKGEICYKSKDDDQSYGMWCPVTYDHQHGLPDGTQFYTSPQAAQPLSDEQKQEIHHETGAGHALISLVESYITKGTT